MESKRPDSSVSINVVATTWNDLAARMKRGDAKALAELYDGTSAVVYGMLLKILGGDAVAAQETLMESYARAWSRIHTFDAERSSLVSWLILLARATAFERPDRQGSTMAAGEGDQQVLQRAFFEGVRESGLREALSRLRQKKGESA